ncbi:hypothetical protein BDY19DRAFT_134251 [Irpex rosettiformis]|uniref:Uncharacterized protein n=1 Tax=Irpex rosettiformis TaxID=378272 RepID=A0ACB8U4P4_9APHY|nr:hypothetical protein BDY19DRAFT_134251 [Irpex rosettiformis]
MSNGQNNAGLSQQLALQLTSLLGRDRMVNGDQLTSILAQVSQARRVLDSIEQEANNRHASYQEMVQQLSARVQQGAEAEQMLRRLGAPVQQIQPNPPPITGAHIVHPPQADGYYFQQPQIQRVPYEAAAAAAQARAAGPSVMQQQSFQSNLHAAQARQPPVTQQFQQAPQPVAQQYYNDFSAQQRPPPPQNAPVAQMHSRAPVPVATSADPNQYRHYREHVGRHEPVRHRPSTSSPVIHPQQGPPTRRQSQSPQIPSPQVPSVAFPPLAPRGTSTRPTVLGGGPTSNAQKASTSISQPTQTSNATAASSSQSTSLTPQQLTAITMKCHDLLKPQSREVLESVIKIVMKEMHIRGKMDLTQNDVEQVYSWKLDPRIAPEVIPLVQTIVQDLTPLRAAQATPILRLIIHTVNRPQHPVNTNVQQLGPRPGTPSTGTSIGNTGSGSVENRPVSSTISVVPQVPNPLLPHGISNSPQVTPRPSSAQPSPLPVSHDPSPFVVPTCISGNETYTQIGVASSTLAVNGHLESEHPANLSAKQTVLNMPSSSQMGSPSTPPTNRRDVPLTPNTKTLSNPGPSSLPTGQQEEFTTRPQTQDSLTNVPTQPAPVPDLQYREKEVIIIDDDSSVSSHPALIDEINGESLSGEPTETPQQQQPPPPPPVRELSSPPSPPSPVAKHTEPILSQADFGVEEIRTPGVMQMAYEEVQEMLQAESNIPAPRTAVDEVIGASTITVPVPTSSSPIIDSAASLPPRSRSSTPTEPMIIDFTPDAHPVAGPSKEPLFLASSPASSSADVENQMTIENDESRFNSDVFVPTGLLGFGMPPSSAVNKGKGRALEPDSDEYDTGGDMQSLRSPPRPVKRRKTEHMEASDSEVVETSESDERVYRSPPQRGLEVYVEVPPMSERCKRYRRDMEWRAGVSGEGKRTNPLVVLSSSSGSDVETGEIDESTY